MKRSHFIVVVALFAILGDRLSAQTTSPLLKRIDPKRWSLVYLAKDDSVLVAYDTDRTKQMDTNVFATWLRWEFATEQKGAAGEKPYIRMLQKVRVDCDARDIRYLIESVTRYARGGKVVGISKETEEWKDVPPGSLGESGLGTACKQFREFRDLFQ